MTYLVSCTIGCIRGMRAAHDNVGSCWMAPGIEPVSYMTRGGMVPGKVLANGVGGSFSDRPGIVILCTACRAATEIMVNLFDGPPRRVRNKDPLQPERHPQTQPLNARLASKWKVVCAIEANVRATFFKHTHTHTATAQLTTTPKHHTTNNTSDDAVPTRHSMTHHTAVGTLNQDKDSKQMQTPVSNRSGRSGRQYATAAEVTCLSQVSVFMT